MIGTTGGGGFGSGPQGFTSRAAAFFGIALDVSVADVYAAASAPRRVYTTVVNVGQGFTDGFYIGHPLAIGALTARLDDAQIWTEHDIGDYESTLLASVRLHRLEHRLTAMVFFKVRKNKEVHWQGGHAVGHLANPRDRAEVLHEWKQLCRSGGGFACKS